MYDLAAIGELLIDFTPAGKTSNGFPVFEQNPGGAPANLLCCASRLGAKTAFIGKVGRDSFGLFLKQVLADVGIDGAGLILDADSETTLAFVHLGDDGNREFSFYREKGADKALAYEDINKDIIDNCRILHFGSLSLTDEPSRSATFKILEYAAEKSKVISFDPNWRERLWKNKGEGIELIKKSLSYANIVKMSEEELALITNSQDIEGSVKMVISNNPHIGIIAITLGEKGCYIANRSDIAYEPGIDSHLGQPVKAVDTTGAGDCFMGALLAQIIRLGGDLYASDIDTLSKAAHYANVAASLCVTKKGGIPSMPSSADVARYI